MSVKVSFNDAGESAKEMNDLSRFIATVNKELRNIKVNTSSPETIEAGIREAEIFVDSCASAYKNNAFVEKTAVDIKKKYRDVLMKTLAEIQSK